MGARTVPRGEVVRDAGGRVVFVLGRCHRCKVALPFRGRVVSDEEQPVVLRCGLCKALHCPACACRCDELVRQ